MAHLRRGSGNAGLRSAAAWAAKLGLLAAGAASAAAAARAVAPRVAALLGGGGGGGGSALPSAWAAARAWLVPPYLFLTVHLIILVIWRLSDHKLHRDHSPPPPPPHEAAEEPAKPRDLARKPTPEPWLEDPAPPPDSSSSSSCVTSESDEGSTASSRVLRLKRSVKPSPGSVTRIEEEAGGHGEGEVEVEVEVEVEGDAENKSMDATWRAIMARSSPAPLPAAEDAAPPPPPPRARRREAAAAAVGGDELTRRFEDFIKRNHDQIRLQREEMMMKNQKMR